MEREKSIQIIFTKTITMIESLQITSEIISVTEEWEQNPEKDKLNNEWNSGPDQKITLESLIMDFPLHLKLHLSKINELINNNI